MNTINTFIDAMENLLNSNVISAGRQIRAFLITITEKEKTKDVIRSCSVGYYLNDDYQRIVINHEPLPISDGKKVAFVTALLFALDTAKLDIFQLLSLLYPTSDTSNGYVKFLSDFIKPYAESFVNLLSGEPVPDVMDTQNQAIAQDKMNADVTSAVNAIVGKVLALPFAEKVKYAIKFAGDGLVYTLSFKDALLTETAYRGLINTLRLYDIKLNQEEFLANTLKLYGVIQ